MSAITEWVHHKIRISPKSLHSLKRDLVTEIYWSGSSSPKMVYIRKTALIVVISKFWLEIVILVANLLERLHWPIFHLVPWFVSVDLAELLEAQLCLVMSEPELPQVYSRGELARQRKRGTRSSRRRPKPHGFAALPTYHRRSSWIR